MKEKLRRNHDLLVSERGHCPNCAWIVRAMRKTTSRPVEAHCYEQPELAGGPEFVTATGL